MFKTFFGFELRYWLRGVMVYLFLTLVVAMVVGAMSTDNIILGSVLENTNRNAPFNVQSFYGILAILTCLTTTAFVNDAASRDFAYKSSQLIFTKPINKFSFLMGRFWGAVAIAIIPMLGVSIGILVSPYLPWNDADRFGPVVWSAHFWGIALFAIPNTIFVAGFIFGIAVWLRSTFASFIGIIGLLMFVGIANSIVGNLDNEFIAQLLDPFGQNAFQTQTKYWTVDDRNSMTLTLFSPMMLLNRAVWMFVGLGILAVTCFRFSFAERRTKASKPKLSLGESTGDVVLPKVNFAYGLSTQLAQLWSQFKVDFFSTIKSPVFLVVVFAGVIDTFMSLRTVATEGFGLSSLPVTYSMIDVIRAGLYLYLLVVIVFYTGVLVWKERESKLDEIYDALPHSTWISYTAKLLVVLCIILVVLFADTVMAVTNQAMAGYQRFQFDLYFTELFLVTFSVMACFTVLAIFLHVVSPNKYVGYILFVVIAIANFFVWGVIDVRSNLLQFAAYPGYTYSDLTRFAPYASGLSWFATYWLLFCGILSCLAVMLWQRGRERGFFSRIKIGKRRFTGSLRLATLATVFAWLGVGGWVFYNTQVLNTYESEKQANKLRSKYEIDFSDLQNLPQPRVTKIRHDIEIYPKKRGLVFKGDQTIVNQTDQPIEKLVLNLADKYKTELEIENATLDKEVKDLNLKIYRFSPPMAPGAEANMKYTVSWAAKGFENSVSRVSLVQNGTFFNNSIAPAIGYQPSLELTNANDRKKFGLGEPELMPPLDPENLEARSNTYISNSSDWVDVETFISTSDDQIAIAPGSLVKKWQKDGRRHFHYKVDHPSLNFYSFVSADYQVESREWNGVDIEVYYHSEHPWNVQNMLISIRDSLEYYSENFGPYKHKQARIIEFPRTSSFAQAFPGTMPYSEGIGFIADIKEKDDIDMVFYVVAHEMAHQWWAHQVIGANMRGATLLSETLAQYSSLMVMEKRFGRDIMRKFLQYEMNNYLRSRGRELLKEMPLTKVGGNQGYVHYRKGSVVMYQLKEMIGEEKVNLALKSLVDKFAYQETGPYPTSLDLVDALREQTPTDLHYLLVDLFEDITLFENRTEDASYRKLENGKYEVSFVANCEKFKADEKGKQSETPIHDWIEIGAFGEPESGSRFGKTLHRERVRISEASTTHSFIVDEVPALVGVDPFSMLIDRTPDNNMKEPVAN